ncbi:MAG: glutaredoxin family protein [Mycobacteriales bacterium]
MSHLVTLLGKPGCHLCDEAREAVARITAELGVRWVERDVTADSQDFAEYGERIPVILIDGLEHGYWRVEEDRLRKALTV